MVVRAARSVLLLPVIFGRAVKRLLRLRKRKAASSLPIPNGTNHRQPYGDATLLGNHAATFAYDAEYRNAAAKSADTNHSMKRSASESEFQHSKYTKVQFATDCSDDASSNYSKQRRVVFKVDSRRSRRNVGLCNDVEQRGVCDPSGNSYRYTFLAVLFCYQFASNLCFDAPAALQDTFERDLRISYSQFMRFYHLYSWPNVLLCLVGGYLVDRVLGVAFSAVLFSAMVTCGQALFAFGAYTNHLALMDVGRVVFSFGNEPLGVVVTAFALRHFGDAEVNLIVGLQLSVEFASNTLCMNLMKAIYGSVFATLHCDAYTAHRCLGVTLALAGVSCLVSVALAWTLVLLDRRIPPNSRNAAMQHGRQSAQSRSTANLPLAAEQSANGRNKSTNSTAVDVETVQNPFNSMVSLSATCSFSVGFWLLGAIGVVYAGTVFQFVSVGVVYFERKYHFSSSEANFCNSLVYVLSAFGCPISGAVVDRIGYNVFWITAGSTLACVGHLLLAFSYVTPYVPVLILGCSYSMLCSAFWSSVGIFVTDQQYGTAIGMIQSLENLALASFALAVGAILDSFGYFAMEIFLLFFAYVSVALSLALLFWSRSTPKLGAVHISAAQRRKQRA